MGDMSLTHRGCDAFGATKTAEKSVIVYEWRDRNNHNA